MAVFLADLSNWQSGVNVGQVVAEGYAGVICKASEGTTYRDPTFDGFVDAAVAAGAIPGAYHFLRAGDGAEQARILHGRVAAHGGPDGFLVACDNEADASWDTTCKFFAEWNRLTGGHPLLMYTGAWWWSPRGWDGASLTPYLWHSRYVSGSGYGSALYGQVPEDWWSPGYGGWGQATILQYSSSAQVAGQTIDVNAFRGSLAELQALTTTGGEGNTMALEGYDRYSADSTLYMLYTALATDADSILSVHVADGTQRTWPNKLKQRLVAIAQGVAELQARPAPSPTLTAEQLAAIGSAAAAEAATIIGERMAELEQRLELLIAGRVAAAAAEAGALAS